MTASLTLRTNQPHLVERLGLSNHLVLPASLGVASTIESAECATLLRYSGSFGRRTYRQRLNVSVCANVSSLDINNVCNSVVSSSTGREGLSPASALSDGCFAGRPRSCMFRRRLVYSGSLQVAKQLTGIGLLPYVVELHIRFLCQASLSRSRPTLAFS